MSKRPNRHVPPRLTGASKRFAIGLCVPLIVALAYWPITICQAPTYSEGIRWLQNNPAISVFQLIFIPIIAGTLFASISPRHLRALVTKDRLISLPLMVLLLLIGVVRVVHDSSEALNGRLIEPLEFRQKSDRTAFLAQDSMLRARIAAHQKPLCDNPALSLDDRNDGDKCYRAFTEDYFQRASITLRSHGGIVSWWQRVLSLQAALLVVFVLWYLICSALARNLPPTITFDAILLCLALFAIWFPLRLYSDWYVNFNSLENLAGNKTLWILAVLFIITLGATFGLRSSELTVKMLAAGLSALSVLCGAVAKFSPETFGKAAHILLEGLDPIAFISLELLLFLFLLGVLRAKAPNTNTEG